MANRHIEIAKDRKSSGIKIGSRPLLTYLVNIDLPGSELTVERLSKEARLLLGAGTLSTARTVDFICYYVLANEDIAICKMNWRI